MTSIPNVSLLEGRLDTRLFLHLRPLRLCKASKYFDLVFLKNFTLLFTFLTIIHVSGRSSALVKKIDFIWKTINQQIWKLFSVNFRPKVHMQNCDSREQLYLELFCTKISYYINLNEAVPSSKQKFIFINSLGYDAWSAKETKIIVNERKTLISSFA